MRILCLYVPRFRVLVEKHRRPDLAELPLILYRGKLRPVVVEACEHAARQGVCEGLMLSRALSLCPQAVTLPEDEGRYRLANAELLQPMLQMSPEVDVANLGLAFMKLRGLQRLVGDEQAAAGKVFHGVQQAGYAARVLVATGRFAADMIARYGNAKCRVVPDGEERAILVRMPVEVLPAPDSAWREMKRCLKLLGVRTLGDVMALGRVAMQARFGKPGLEAWRLINGEDERFLPLFLPPEIEAGRDFSPPLDTWEQLETATARLATELSIGLRRESNVCLLLAVVWQVEGSGRHSRRVSLKEPSAARDAILSAARRSLKSQVDGPLSELRLQAEVVVPGRGKQMSLFCGRKTTLMLERLATDLQQRLGKPALYRVQYVGPSHLEERIYSLWPIGTAPMPCPGFSSESAQTPGALHRYLARMEENLRRAHEKAGPVDKML